MTINDFEIGDVWVTHLGRRVEIVATHETVIEENQITVGVIAYRPHGLQMIQMRDADDTVNWKREVE